MGSLAARQMGDARIIAMSRHKQRQALVLEYGTTDIVAKLGNAGVAQIKAITRGVGADSGLECVGTQESMQQALHVTRPGSIWSASSACHMAWSSTASHCSSRRSPARWSGADSPLPAAADGPGADAQDQSWQGTRPRNCRWPTWLKAIAR